MFIFRVFLKLILVPVMALLTIGSLLAKVSIEVGARVGAVIINIFLVIGIINLIGHDIPLAAISGVIIVVVLGILFFAANLQLICDSLRDNLRRI
ncbi:hypothetical protein SAMN05421493_101272 [Pseudobutyrivibrio sp. 49]|uniref:hypothetical protein n=1 Tax=Pseudobutyrivibrio sp. 49 TaxID=1855344 RepID=UPI00088F3867|nr:hypothetical protein [Pseudobutyrivibrio sp. 49]SDH30780.1 hypothetical protein SAMN05421493_101272 [Pseudobutyrivibrio sp. 49]